MQNSELKKFIKGIEGLTADVIAFLLTNKMAFAVTNVEKNNKTGVVTLQTVTNFHIVENFSMTKDEQKVWDLFNDFTSAKNATAVILDCIESNTFVTSESYKNQGKITPKQELPKINTFCKFWELLDEGSKAQAVTIAERWLADNHINETSFDFFFVNGTNGVTLKAGDYVTGYDSHYGQTYYTRVFQASEKGFVTCLDNGGYFSLSGSSKPSVVSRESVPAEISKILDEVFVKLNDEVEEQKEYRLNKAMKFNEKITLEEVKKAEKEEKAKAKEEAKALADAEKLKVFEELNTMEINSIDDIKSAVEKMNSAKLAKEQTEIVRTRFNTIKDDLKAKQKAEKEAKVETVKVETVAPITEPAPETPKATRNRGGEKVEPTKVDKKPNQNKK